jgi:hypothetical protein
MNTGWLIWSSLFALIGLAVFVYGRRQRRGAPMLIGVALMVYSYFLSSSVAVIAVGVLLLGALVVGNRLEDSL